MSEEIPYKLDDYLKAITLDEAIKNIESCNMLRDLDNNDDYWMHCALMTAKAARLLKSAMDAMGEMLDHEHDNFERHFDVICKISEIIDGGASYGKVKDE